MSDETTLPDGDTLFLRPARGAAPDRLLSYAVADGNGPDPITVLFVHGGGGNKNQWRRQWRHFAPAGHRLVAWDGPGHGESPRPADPRAYHGQVAAADALAFFRRFAARRTVLVAHSYGCRLALALLLALKEAGELDRVSSALLLAPPPPDGPLSLGPLFALPAFVLEALRPRLAAGFRAAAWHPATDPALIAHEEAASRRNSMVMVKALFGGALSVEPSRLAGLDVPVHVAVGESDRLTPPSVAERLAGLIPRARLHTIAGAGHQVMLEQPEAVNRLIEALIDAPAVGQAA